MQRTMLLMRDARLAGPVVVDLFRVVGAAEHTYDYPIHFRGQLITTNVKYAASSTSQTPFGKGAGYQHIWKTASGPAPESVLLTWLEGSRYYSITTAASKGDEVLFGRTGANDSSFNLISEPMMLLRSRAKTKLFASVIEPHGFFSEPEERSTGATPNLNEVQVLADDNEGSVVEITGANGIKLTVMVSNGSSAAGAHHHVAVAGKAYDWTGSYFVQGVHRTP